MHSMLDQAVGEMTADQLNFRPQEGGVSGFFSLWHFVRTEDNVINWVLQQQPTVWLDGGHDEAFGLPHNAQGTGMTEDEANAGWSAMYPPSSATSARSGKRPTATLPRCPTMRSRAAR